MKHFLNLSKFQNNNPNLLNAIGVSGVSTNPGLNAIGNMQPMQAQKYLNQGAHNASGTGMCVVVVFNKLKRNHCNKANRKLTIYSSKL